MPRITPIHYRKLAKVFEKKGFKHLRTQGDHLVYGKLKLKGKTAVFIDWANVYGWKKSLRKEIDPTKLYNYLKTYKETETIYFCFGRDKHPKSKKQIFQAKRLGYKIVTKPVKHILAAQIKGKKIYKRKCDFDMEIAIKAHELLNKDIQGFIFFTGDGDFEPLYKLCLLYTSPSPRD